MTDPWPYARELRVKNTLELTEETAMLLSDADALLAVVRHLRPEDVRNTINVMFPVMYDDDEFGKRLLELEKALAALPEHLR